jgi:hypothetical protein
MMTLLSVACLALGMTVPLTGTVVDSQGRPVAGAKVWLGDTHNDRKGPEVLAATQTDEQGHFQLERDSEVTGRGKAWSPTLWAYKADARLAYQEFKAKLPAGFRTPNQIPIGTHEYLIVASAVGYEKAASTPFSRPIAEAVTLTLRRSLGHREVAGEVVDSKGMPSACAISRSSRGRS